MNLKLLMDAINNDQVIDFFKGTKGYRILGMNGDPSNALAQDHNMVVSAFHLLCREKTDLDISGIMARNLESLLQSTEPFDIYTSLKIIDSQMFSEHSKFCVFKLKNPEGLLEKLKNNLLANQKVLDSIIFPGETLTVWQMAVRCSEFANNRYNVSYL